MPNLVILWHFASWQHWRWGVGWVWWDSCPENRKRIIIKFWFPKIAPSSSSPPPFSSSSTSSDFLFRTPGSKVTSFFLLSAPLRWNHLFFHLSPLSPSLPAFLPWSMMISGNHNTPVCVSKTRTELCSKTCGETMMASTVTYVVILSSRVGESARTPKKITLGQSFCLLVGYPPPTKLLKCHFGARTHQKCTHPPKMSTW